jgi:hypothetical protein
MAAQSSISFSMVSKKVILVLFLHFFVVLTNQVIAQKDTSKKVTTVTNQVESENSEQIKALSNSVQDLKTQNAVLTKTVDNLTLIFSLFAGLIGLVLIIGTVTSYITWNTDRKRSNETYHLAKEREQQTAQREQLVYARQDELYTFALAKDKEATERDRSIFGQSTQTLTLVNQTLELARDASERASKSLEIKLNKKHTELEQEAIELIEESRAFKNYKILVEDSNFRSNLLTLALEIAGLQNNQNILEREVTLHPNCSFIRGMEFHLNQHFKTAIKYWKQVKDNIEAVPELKIMALYWIAYEQNNLKDFENAATNFESASSIAKGAMKFELERIKIESKFFDFPKYTPDKLIPELLALNELAKKEPESEEMKKVKSSIVSTIGNIYHEMGNKSSGEKAKEFYTKARNSFNEAPYKNKWTWFGYGESSYRLGNTQEAENILLGKVKSEAEFEYSTRLEPRTKVLGQTTVLICSVRVKSLNENVNTLYNLIKTTLGGVDERLTVYSQFQRRNVDKKTFVKDLDDFMEEFNSTTNENTLDT